MHNLIELRASQTKRWTNCPPSYRLAESIQGSELSADNFYADEGTLMHELVALEAERMLSPQLDPKVYNQRLATIQEDKLYDTEMLDFVEVYVERLRAIVNDCQARQRDFTFYLEHTMQTNVNGVQISGTADALIESDDTLYIIDFKYGMGIFIPVYDNPQLFMYALLYQLTTGKSFKRIVLTIVQPRLDNVETAEYNRDDLFKFYQKVLKAIEDIVENTGALNIGDWCKYCKAKPRCPKYKELYDDMISMNTLPALLTDKEVAVVLQAEELLVSWLKEVKEMAFNRAMSGYYYPGFKLVEKRQRRVILDEFKDAVVATLISSGVESTDVFETKLAPITHLEKRLGKKQFNELLGDFITLSPQSYDLVDINDRRPAAELTKAGDEF